MTNRTEFRLPFDQLRYVQLITGITDDGFRFIVFCETPKIETMSKKYIQEKQ